jgi:MerR family transcriptional regulator, heat shock protein HspR
MKKRMATQPRKKARAGYMISAVAELYKIHPQTLRLYERAGLLKPSRSQGNTRLYTEEDLVRLEVILTLTREMGVNLAGIDVILNMRDKMEQMQQEMEGFITYVRSELGRNLRSTEDARSRHAIMRTAPPKLIRVEKSSS